jgi:EF hand
MTFCCARPIFPNAARAARMAHGAFALAAALLALGAAHAQNQPAPDAAAPAPPAAQTPAPRYAASELERAFGFMDHDHNGQVSREEAAGFRGVAKNFDRADTDRDGQLSRAEFDAAMNYVKPQ